jgi:hypothetical protein
MNRIHEPRFTPIIPDPELLTIRRRGVALDWPESSYLEAAAWCGANGNWRMQEVWRRMADSAGVAQ